MEQLCSLSYWLLNSGAAGHVERLEVGVPYVGDSRAAEVAAWHTLCGILAACGAAGRLTDVAANLDFCRGITVGGWAAAALRSVRRLHIATAGTCAWRCRCCRSPHLRS